jgi:integrase
MASLQQRSSGLYLLSFRYQGRQYQRSLETTQADEATHIRQNVEHRLKLLAKGTLRLPAGAAAADLWQILLTGQLPSPPVKLIHETSLGAVRDEYLKSYPKGSKEPDTLKTERVHCNNFARILGSSTPLHSITSSDIEHYIHQRLAERGNRDSTIKADTVRKELQTFRLVWRFAKRRGHVFAECPVDDANNLKRREKPRFQTWEQIVSTIERSQPTEGQSAGLWDGLFLRETEVAEFLDHVRLASRLHPRFAYIYPALCFCAYTGARRSEMFRAEVGDIADGWITLREKKRKKDVQTSSRLVPLNPELAPVLDVWLLDRAGGPYLFCKRNRQPLDDRTSREAFEAVTKDSKWSVLRGYHVLRHSFASNLARSGNVSAAEIDEMMGHETEEMRRRYRHLLPEDIKRAANSLSYRVT